MAALRAAARNTHVRDCIEFSSSSLQWFTLRWPAFFASPVKWRVAGVAEEAFGIALGAADARHRIKLFPRRIAWPFRVGARQPFDHLPLRATFGNDFRHRASEKTLACPLRAQLLCSLIPAKGRDLMSAMGTGLRRCDELLLVLYIFLNFFTKFRLLGVETMSSQSQVIEGSKLRARLPQAGARGLDPNDRVAYHKLGSCSLPRDRAIGRPSPVSVDAWNKSEQVRA
jgi:hypothetical protein